MNYKNIRYNDATLSRLIHEIYPDKDFSLILEKDISNKEILKHYINCLKDISKGVSYVCNLKNKEPNFFGKIYLKFWGININHKINLEKNIEKYNFLVNGIRKFVKKETIIKINEKYAKIENLEKILIPKDNKKEIKK